MSATRRPRAPATLHARAPCKVAGPRAAGGTPRGCCMYNNTVAPGAARRARLLLRGGAALRGVRAGACMRACVVLCVFAGVLGALGELRALRGLLRPRCRVLPCAGGCRPCGCVVSRAAPVARHECCRVINGCLCQALGWRRPQGFGLGLTRARVCLRCEQGAGAPVVRRCAQALCVCMCTCVRPLRVRGRVCVGCK